MNLSFHELERQLEADPVSHLVQLHRRMEQQLGILSSVARKRGCTLSTPQQKQFQAALRFCRDWAPVHWADVEQAQSLLLPVPASPQTLPAIPSEASPLGRVRQEHARLASLHRQVEALGQRWMTSHTLSQPDALSLEASIDQLQALYRPLFQAREQGLYARLRQQLSKDARVQLREGMLSRWCVPEPGEAVI